MHPGKTILGTIIALVILGAVVYVWREPDGGADVSVREAREEGNELGAAPAVPAGTRSPSEMRPEEIKAVSDFKQRILRRIASNIPLTEEEKGVIFTAYFVHGAFYAFTDEELQKINNALSGK